MDTLLQSASLISLRAIHTAAGLFGIGFLIAFHEFGHYIFCKIFGIHTPSFSIGFGPPIFSKKFGDTQFIIAPIPLGGYVEIAGSAEVGQGEQEQAYSQADNSFNAKPYYQRLLVMFGGIMFNFAFAYAVFVGIFMTGIPKTNLMARVNTIPVVELVEKTKLESLSNPSKYLQAEDRVISFNKAPITDDTLISLVQQIQSMPGKSVPVTVMRNGREVALTILIGSTEIQKKAVGTLGIQFKTTAREPYPFWESITRGISLTNQYIVLYAQAYFNLFKNASLKGVGGPLMLISQTIGGASAGIKTFLIYLAIISINLAVLNLIPLPIMDGGQILFTTIEAVIRRPLPTQVKQYIHLATWFAMLALIMYLSFFDIINIFSPYLSYIKSAFGM